MGGRINALVLTALVATSVAATAAPASAVTPSIVSAGSVTLFEGTGDPTIVKIPVTIAPAATDAFQVTYTVTAGTAGADDLTLRTGTLQIDAGDSIAQIAVTVNADALDEPDEKASVVLSDPTGGNIIGTSSTITILDDDDAPTLSISPATLVEGLGAPRVGNVDVTLSAPSGRRITVRAKSTDLTAASPADYAAIDQILTFPPGTTSRPVRVSVANDSIIDGGETFRLTLSNPVSAGIAAANAIVTIDDPSSSLSAADVQVNEDAPATAVVTISTDLVSTVPLSVNVDTVPGSATADDFTPVSTVATIAPGTTSTTVSIPITADQLDERDESFLVVLSNPVNGVVGDPNAKVTILDDDATPSLSIDDVAVRENRVGNVVAKTTITLSAPSGLPVTFTWATANGTAKQPGDYAAATDTVTIAAGKTTASASTTVAPDTLAEGQETFFFVLSDASNASIADNKATVSIDDALPLVTIDDGTLKEGPAAKDGTVQVRLSIPSVDPVSVRVVSSDLRAKGGADYAVIDQVVTVPAGSLSAPLTYTVLPDELDEPDEPFKLTLSEPVGGELGAAPSGVITIIDDDPQPSLAIAPASVFEGNTGTRRLRFTVSLSEPSGQPVTFDAATGATGTATGGVDYVALAPTTITIPAGNTDAVVEIVVNGDRVVEKTESLSVVLTNPTAASLRTASAVGKILNDD